MNSSINTTEIQQFQKDSSHWWDETGPFAPLHKMNPARLAYIIEKTKEYSASNTKTEWLDIGCGGGLLCEPLKRLGYNVTGIDADSNAIKVATEHAKDMGLKIAYKHGEASDLLSAKKRYDFVSALEIIEHVNNPSEFVSTCAQLLKPKGLLFMSTLTRTKKSFLLGKIAAEYIVKWVPAGTHDWNKFIKPSELNRFFKANSLELKDIGSIEYSIVNDSFAVKNKTPDLNYICIAQKK